MLSMCGMNTQNLDTYLSSLPVAVAFSGANSVPILSCEITTDLEALGFYNA